MRDQKDYFWRCRRAGCAGDFLRTRKSGEKHCRKCGKKMEMLEDRFAKRRQKPRF